MPLTKSGTVCHLNDRSKPSQREVKRPSKKSSETVLIPDKVVLSICGSKSGLRLVFDNPNSLTLPKTTCGTRSFASAVDIPIRKPNNSGALGSSETFNVHLVSGPKIVV